MSIKPVVEMLSPIKPRTASLAAAILLVVFLGIALAYASTQSLWVDEATQLSGVKLPYDEQLNWLLGANIEAIRVPHDRSPPLSYWIGRMWQTVFGPGEFGMRLLGIASVFAGLIVLYRGVSAKFGECVGLATLAYCCLFPGLIVQATEIRAYPMLFLFSVLVLHACLRVLGSGPTRGSLIYLFAACVGATYTHFFGLVLSCSALLVLAAGYFFETRRIPPSLALTICAYLIASSALAFFVVTAVNVSGESPKPSGLLGHLTSNAKLAYRLVAHQSMKQFPAGDAIAVLTAAVLVVTGLLRAAKAAHSTTALAILLVGFAVVSIASLLTTRFDPLAPSYNVWMIPFTAVAIAQGAASWETLQGVRRVLPLVLFSALMGVSILGDVALARNGPMYGHTRSRDLHKFVEKLEPEHVTVIYLNNAGRTYFPMNYWYGETLQQYVLEGDNMVSTITGRHVGEFKATPYVIVAATTDLGAQELRGVISGQTFPRFPEAGQTLEKLLRAYNLEQTLMLPAQEALLLKVYTRNSVGRGAIANPSPHN